ncbi:MAG: SMP-30/gluconolactonase/LRE family protein [Kiritimatiellae bacterium]|nr:SMP-30/gluconolactonase/LRE family protein [Kiritimatiellia bacterium]
MKVEPELVVRSACHTGESPLWHPDEKCLYWVDIPEAKLFRYDPSVDDTHMFEMDAPVGGFTINSDGRLLLFMAEGAVCLWDHGVMETVIDSLPEERGNRFNDVIADPEGRVFCGVMSTPDRAGRLYRLDPDGAIKVMLEDTGTANGMGFSLDLRYMYFCDTRRHTMYIFDYDMETGDLSNRKAFITVDDESEGRPDGMTVDSEGCVWSARWGGAQIVRHSFEGDVLQRISFPVKNVSCLTFGGPDYTDIYITTAGAQDAAENGDLSGSLFHLNLGVRGNPEFRSRQCKIM